MSRQERDSTLGVRGSALDQQAQVLALPLDRNLRANLGLLVRVRVAVIRNTIHETMRTQPLRIVGTAGSLLVIWGALYFLLIATFWQVKREALQGIVAVPLMFTFFFLALTGMLAFSTAILCYGSMFRRKETEYLLSGPFLPRDIVIARYLEGLVLASWSLVLLGLPLMMAVASVFKGQWSFYPLFLGLFLMFIPLPGALGLVLAWLIALVSPKTPQRAILFIMGLLIAVGAWWAWGILRAPVSANQWLRNFYDHVGLLQNALLPHTWVSKGITSAMQGQSGQAAFYLWITVANSLFASLIAVTLVSRGYVPAYARAQVTGSGSARRSGRVIAAVADVLFAYLPRAQRLLASKDLRTFFRDPLQWSQMAILLGLMSLYVSNVQRLWTDLADPRLQLLIGFLNLTAVSLILATFTSRFVFPLISLEGQQLWLLGLLPLSRGRMVFAKFLYALTVTLFVALAVMAVSVYRLQLPTSLAVMYVVAIGSICVGLCGMSIGMGARLPVFTERNPARIAGGFGGTVSLLLSVALVVLSLLGVGVMSLTPGAGERFTSSMLGWLTAIVAVNTVSAAIAMLVGIRHFKRLEV
jgi:ABC-2 type transport system permease protein